MKKLLITILLLFSLAGCSNADLNSLLSSIEFDTYESTASFSMVSVGENNSNIKFEYTISEENEYVKTVKTFNSDVETNIIYKKDTTYYLYQDKNNKVLNMELTQYDANTLFNAVILERDELYTITTEASEYDKSKDSDNTVISFDERVDDILYSIKVTYCTTSNKFVSLQKKYTLDNTITTVNLTVGYTLDLSLPQGAL